MINTKCAHASFLHVDVGRLEATLVDVVEGEGLSGVGTVFVHLHHSSSSSLRLLLLSSGCHDFRKCESHGNTHTHFLFLSYTHALVRWCSLKGIPLQLGSDGLVQVFGTSRTVFSGSATGIESLHASPQSQYTSSHNTPEEKRYEMQDKGRCER